LVASNNGNTTGLTVSGANLNGGTITNAAGAAADLSGIGATFSGLQIDTTVPLVSITSPGGLTNQAVQTISGTVDVAVGSTVLLYDSGTLIGTATVGNGGAWSTSVTLAGDGTHSIVAKDTDPAGNTGASSAVVFTLDTIPPVVSISSAGGLTNQASQTISGTVDAIEAAVSSTVSLYDSGTLIGTAAVDSGGGWSTTVTLSGDGTHSIVAQNTDAANNTGASSAVVFTLDADATEQAGLKLTVNSNSAKPIGTSGVGTVAFTAAGLDPEDTGTVTFTDANGKTVEVSVNGGQTSYTANLTMLSDGAIASSLSVNPDPAGNTFTAVSGNGISFDQDLGEQAALGLTVNGNSATPIGAAGAGTVAFTVAGLDPEDTGTVTFTDANGKTVSVNVNGGQTSYTADLSSLIDGAITSSFSPNTDSTGNSFTAVPGNTVTLDQDTGEQAALKLTVNSNSATPIGKSGGGTVAFTVAGLDPEDTGTVTFTDINGKTVNVSVSGGQTGYTANLSSLADGTITSSLSVNTDPAGNSFTPVSATAIRRCRSESPVPAPSRSRWRGSIQRTPGRSPLPMPTARPYRSASTAARPATRLISHRSPTARSLLACPSTPIRRAIPSRRFPATAYRSIRTAASRRR
jgi:ABC-type iron transport system FetAB ATPase subunit